MDCFYFQQSKVAEGKTKKQKTENKPKKQKKEKKEEEEKKKKKAPVVKQPEASKDVSDLFLLDRRKNEEVI